LRGRFTGHFALESAHFARRERGRLLIELHVREFERFATERRLVYADAIEVTA